MLSFINTVTNAIIEQDMQVWGWIYGIMACLALVYFILWRKRQFDDPKSTYNLNTTKRKKAIEQFQNMTQTVIKTATSTPNKAITNEELARLSQTAIDEKCAALPAFDEIVPNGKTYMLPEIHKAIADRLVTDKSSNKPNTDLLEILNDNYPVIDTALAKFVTDMYAGFNAEYSTADRNNVYIRETNLEGQINGFDDAVKKLTETKIEGILYDVFYNPNLADEAQKMVFIYKFGADFPPIRLQNMLITREVRERLFGNVENDSKRLFRDLCSINSQINRLEKDLILSEGTASKTLEINQQLDQQKFKQADQQAKYRLTLLVLAKLATKQTTRETIQKQTELLASMAIQPVSLNQADTIRGAPVIQRPDGTYSSPGEVDLSRQYSGAYQQYLDDLKARDGDTILDPVKILGTLEEGTVNLLAGLSDAVKGRPQEVQQRLGKQTNNLGTWMTSRDTPVGDRNLSLGTPMTNREVELLSRKSGPTREGFADTPKTSPIPTKDNKKPADGGIDGVVVGFAEYIMDFLAPYLGEQNIAGVQRTLSDESNMIPIGFVLILVSVFLYFIDISS